LFQKQHAKMFSWLLHPHVTSVLCTSSGITRRSTARHGHITHCLGASPRVMAPIVISKRPRDISNNCACIQVAGCNMSGCSGPYQHSNTCTHVHHFGPSGPNNQNLFMNPLDRSPFNTNLNWFRRGGDSFDDNQPQVTGQHHQRKSTICQPEKHKQYGEMACKS
jgi:hypothetical protein